MLRTLSGVTTNRPNDRRGHSSLSLFSSLQSQARPDLSIMSKIHFSNLILLAGLRRSTEQKSSKQKTKKFEKFEQKLQQIKSLIVLAAYAEACN